MTGWPRAWRVMLLSAVLAPGACASGGANGWTQVSPATEGAAPTLNVAGVVRHLDIEGGLFVIIDAQGTRFSPTNLPQAFQADGLRVEAQARRRVDLVSIGMAGPLIELFRIRRVPDGPRP